MAIGKAWSRRKAQRVRKRHPYARCGLCGDHACKKVVLTDWSFTGWIVEKRCYGCRAVSLQGPRWVIERQVNVGYVKELELGQLRIGLCPKSWVVIQEPQ